MDPAVVAHNLLRLRKDRGLTQERAAEAAGLSRATFRALEKGRTEARPEQLRALASLLAVPLRELFAPVARMERVRFRSQKRLKSRDQILVGVSRWLRDFNELEELLGERRPHALEPLWQQVRAIRGEGIPAVAAAARHQFGLRDREPVHDVCGLLEARGVKVRPVVVTNDAFLGLSVAEEDGGPAVVVNTWDRLAVEHWIYSAVHELGHLLLHLGAYDVSLEHEEEEQEREAETFASHFLMPEEVFRDEWEEAAGLSLYDRVLKVKRVFRVSWRVVLYRVTQQLPKEQRAHVWQQMAIAHQRRKHRPLHKLTEPYGVAEDTFRAPRALASAGAEPAALDVHDFQGDRLARLVRRAVDEEVITLSRGAEVLGLTVAEMRSLAASWVT